MKGHRIFVKLLHPGFGKLGPRLHRTNQILGRRVIQLYLHMQFFKLQRLHRLVVKQKEAHKVKILKSSKNLIELAN